MVIGHKTPIATVIAVVAIITHHQVVAGRHLAAKALLIVNAVLATRERPHILWVDRLRGGILGDGVKMVARALLKALRRHVHQPLQIAVVAIGRLRQRRAIDGEFLVTVDDLITRQPDHAFDEVLRRVNRIAEHDYIAALRFADRNDLLFDDRQPYPVSEFVHQNEVADLQRGTHRRAGNLERFGNERAQ